jgi:hypothetical protein
MKIERAQSSLEAALSGRVYLGAIMGKGQWGACPGDLQAKLCEIETKEVWPVERGCDKGVSQHVMLVTTAQIRKYLHPGLGAANGHDDALVLACFFNPSELQVTTFTNTLSNTQGPICAWLGSIVNSTVFFATTHTLPLESF